MVINNIQRLIIYTGKEMIFAPFLAATPTNSHARLMLSCLLAVTKSCMSAVLNSYFFNI